MKIFLLAVLGFCTTLTFAQSPVQNITIKGLVIDSAINKPLSFVTVALTDAASNAPVKSMLTKDDGTFELGGVPQKRYKLALVYMGYGTKVIDIPGDKKMVDVGSVLLAATHNQLKEVSVVAARPLMKQEVDRLSYDVQADPEAKAVTALDMIRKVPLLSVDGNDNIKLRGSGNYKILLNGKESALMARNPSDILKAMPGTNIVKIEVITTPPAKYDAEGLAGIINIITQKKGDEGYNGSVNLNYNSIWGPRANINLTAKKGKFGVNAYAGTGHRPKRPTDFYNQTDFLLQPSSVVQTGNRFGTGNNNYVSTELSFEADSLNLLTGTFNYYRGTNLNLSTQFTTETNAGVANSYTTTNNGDGAYHGADFGLNYQLGFKGNKDRLLTASYKYSDFGNNALNLVSPGNSADFRQLNNSGAKEHTTQLDYVHPLKKLNIEAGGKMINRNNYSTFHTDLKDATGNYMDNSGQANDFDYHQNVYSAYNSYTLKFTKWTFKAGARYERTEINANFTSTSTNLNQSYTNVVPSFSMQRSLNNSSLTFGFTQRIQRPGIWQLNPFVDSTNTKYISRGNPALRPAVNNNFELSYGNFAKGSLNISLSYAFANNTIQNLSSVNGTVTTSTYANVGKNKNLGLDVNWNYPITTKFNVNVNAEIMRVWLKGTFNNEFFTNSGYQGHVFTNSSYKFSDGYRVGVNVGFDSRYVLLQGIDNYYLGYGFNASKELFNKKATLSLYANGPFSKFIKLDFYTHTDSFNNFSYNYQNFRSIGIGFNYKFGSLSAAIKKNQRGINNDDSLGGAKN
ncbi:TonB-dependent receptor [Mucilaginibacter sp. 14171R-50]|uniref:TonB-dependent receptor domain-containing protein n=1 Tax=Mucilaginibacter sp. 14171R-50 TaxID=2703789 RepID=UPI00138B324D|nr:TonB-dependent receptor [Mucilaginibacter sp. 14171R-50]QHS54303.1 TonB-dependent receptor [Mucilaginibacter sp. 14171R-50]